MAQRPWCATVSFPDRQPFMFGTVWLSRNEGEESARNSINSLLNATFPTLPEIHEVHPGQMVFVEDDD